MAAHFEAAPESSFIAPVCAALRMIDFYWFKRRFYLFVSACVSVCVYVFVWLRLIDYLIEKVNVCVRTQQSQILNWPFDFLARVYRS